MTSSWFLSVGLLIYIVHVGSALKCFSYSCTNLTGVPGGPHIQGCSPPQVITCDKYEDRCFSQRIISTTPANENIRSIVEERKCATFMASQCHIPHEYCKLSNSSGHLTKCNLGCCQGDLCNTGPIPSPAPEPTGKISGSDLSCYSCATMNLLGLKNTTTDCERPITGTCGTSLRFGGMKQDRCLDMTGVFEIGGGIKRVFKMRNCSDPFYCNQDFACKYLNTSGLLKSCKMSCCYGKLCNGQGPIDKPTKPSGSSLSCYGCSNTKEIFGLKFPETDCKNPVKQTCGPSPIPGIKQDQCLQMRFLFKEKGKVEPIEIRNCSNSYYCNKEFICKGLNRSGNLQECDISCCFGNLCNNEGLAAKSPPVAVMSMLGVLLMGVAATLLM